MYDNAKFQADVSIGEVPDHGLMPKCSRQAKFSIFCSHVEDQLVDMKNLITPGISKVPVHHSAKIFAEQLGAGDKMERSRSKGKSEWTVSSLRDRLFRMYRPANQQVDYVKCFNKLLGRDKQPSLHPVGSEHVVRLRTSELGQTVEPAPDELRCDPILPTHHG